jgi:hypothetical protein
MSGDEEDNFQYRILSQQGGAKVTRSEEAALRLVKEIPKFLSPG